MYNNACIFYQIIYIIDTQPNESQRYLAFQWNSDSAAIFKQKIKDSAELMCENVECLDGNANQDSIAFCIHNYATCSSALHKMLAFVSGDNLIKNVNDILNKDNNNNQQPWFDAECRAARREYFNVKNRLKRKLKFLGGSEATCLFNHYETTGKLYKNLLRHKRRTYHRDLNESLLSLQASNPKECWQLLNSNNGRKGNKIGNVSLGDFVNHFSRLGNS